MLKLYDNEKIVLIIHKHWFVMARTIATFAALVFIPPVILTFLPLATEQFDIRIVEPATNFFLSLYIMVLFIFLFLLWMDYYLDMWIITTSRIIDAEQHGLFNREISEIPLQHVQDVTIEIKGFIETFLKFGRIRIQTAGEREFTINFVPHLYEAKEVIIKYAHEAQKTQLPVTSN
ncbi:MAG: PH domain-containing protein [Candidatus Sungbacteria bacterium]|nr:PH domain-containing protein [Candidatus Sungbacteria bacterium]